MVALSSIDVWFSSLGDLGSQRGEHDMAGVAGNDVSGLA
jgi:hypothetical protein